MATYLEVSGDLSPKGLIELRNREKIIGGQCRIEH